MAATKPSRLVLPALAPISEESAPRANPAHVYLARLSRGGSESVQLAALQYICAWLLPEATIDTFPWGELRHEHTIAVRAHLAGRYAASTANRMISALRGALRSAWRLEQMTYDQLERACDLPQVRGERLPCGRWIPERDRIDLFKAAAAQPPRRAARDTALLWLLFGAGLRRCELTRLDRSDVTFEKKSVFVRVIGKNNRERRVPLPPQAAEAVRAYVRFRGSEPGPLFISQKRRRPCGVTIGRWVERLAGEAMVEHTTAHDFRRTYISALLDHGVDVPLVQKLAGHMNSNTTARYDRRPEDARVRAVGVLHVPAARGAGRKRRKAKTGSSPARAAARRPRRGSQ